MGTLIGVTGKARSGKNAAAAALVARRGYHELAFADRLKETAAALLGMPLHMMYGGDREAVLPEYGYSIRQVLQLLGTEGVRHVFGDDFWIKCVARRLRQYKEAYGDDYKLVVTDVRYDNEAEWIRANGGIVVHIIGEYPGYAHIATPDHVSEKGLSPGLTDWTLVNNGSLDQLADAMEAAAAYAEGRA